MRSKLANGCVQSIHTVRSEIFYVLSILLLSQQQASTLQPTAHNFLGTATTRSWSWVCQIWGGFWTQGRGWTCRRMWVSRAGILKTLQSTFDSLSLNATTTTIGSTCVCSTGSCPSTWEPSTSSPSTSSKGTCEIRPPSISKLPSSFGTWGWVCFPL